ncbi:MAG: DUF1857 family protein [Bacteroidia bacterium]|nr:DUF1857 family protein [Bacteroidia bacterium]
MISYSENIQMPLDLVWKNFIYKIEHPEHFVPGVSNVLIKEKTDEFIIREMDIEPPGGSKFRIVEKITHSPYLVKFLIIEHPVYSGYVDNTAEKISDTETKITFSQNWLNKETGEQFRNEEMIKNAVQKTIKFILQQRA